MNRYRRNKSYAFTLVELLIVIGIMLIMTGLVAQVWVDMNRLAVTSFQKASNVMHSQRVLQQIAEDIKRSYHIDITSESILELQQLTPSGKVHTLRYQITDNELVRELNIDSEQSQSLKVMNLNAEQLLVSDSLPDLIRLEIRLPASGRPGDIRDQQLITYVHTEGVIP